MWDRLLADFWGLIGMFIVGVLYIIMHRGIAMSQAKKTAMTLMLGAEKRAEQLLLVTGQDKFNWVIDKGYDLLPAAPRMFISKPAFRNIVQELFDGTVRMTQSYFRDGKAGAAKPQMTETISAGTMSTAIPLPAAGMTADAPYGYQGSVAIHPGMPPVPPMPRAANPSDDGAPV